MSASSRGSATHCTIVAAKSGHWVVKEHLQNPAAAFYILDILVCVKLSTDDVHAVRRHSIGAWWLNDAQGKVSTTQNKWSSLVLPFFLFSRIDPRFGIRWPSAARRQAQIVTWWGNGGSFNESKIMVFWGSWPVQNLKCYWGMWLSHHFTSVHRMESVGDDDSDDSDEDNSGKSKVGGSKGTIWPLLIREGRAHKHTISPLITAMW